MNHHNPQKLPCLCFLQIYKQNIQCKLQEIDVFLKTTPTPYNPRDVSALLHIDLNDLIYIMQKKDIATLNIISFFAIVQTASSYICKLIQRQWEYGTIKYYTPEAIAYIYELNLEKVEAAFKESGLSQVGPHNIQELFQYIYVPVMNL